MAADEPQRKRQRTQQQDWFARSHKWVLDVFRDTAAKQDKVILFRAVAEPADHGSLLRGLHPSVLLWLQMRNVPKTAAAWALCVSAFSDFVLPPPPPTAPPPPPVPPQTMMVVERTPAKLVLSGPGMDIPRDKEKGGAYDGFLKKKGAPPPRFFSPDTYAYSPHATRREETEARLAALFMQGSALANTRGSILYLPRLKEEGLYVLLVKRADGGARVGAAYMQWHAGAAATYFFRTSASMRANDDCRMAVTSDAAHFLEQFADHLGGGVIIADGDPMMLI